jgi:hypothetical protein
MCNSFRRLAFTGLVLAAALASTHCERDADAPAATAAADCCEVTPNAGLPAGTGRIVVRYPGDGGAESTPLEVFAAGDASKALGSEYGDATLELPPSTYDVTVGGRRVAGVGVQVGHDTRIRVGVLHVHASKDTRIDLLDHASGATLTSGYGEGLYGLPVGSVAVQIAGQREAALIEDGKVTDFRRLGRITVAYPEKVDARIDVFKPGETQAVASGYGDAAFDLFPGTYDVAISGKRVGGVTVQSAHDTQIEVGVLRVTASEGTRVDQIDAADKKAFTSGYGTQAFGLAVGEVGVQIAGQTEAVVIEAGQVTEF